MNIWFVTKYGKVKSPQAVPARSYCLVRGFTQLGHNAVLLMSDSTRNTNVPSFEGKNLLVDNGEIEICWIKAPKFDRARSISRIISWFGFEYNFLTMDKSGLCRPDVIIASSLSLLTVISAVLLAIKYKCKVVFEVRDIWPLTLTENAGMHRWNPFILFLRLVELSGYRLADAVVGTMPNLQQHVSQSVSSNIDVRCIPMGISYEIVESDTVPVPLNFKARLDSSKFNIVYCGSFGHDNALDNFFALARLAGDNPSIAFHAVGKGDLKETYRSKYGEFKNLTFHDPVNSTSVTAVLKTCDLLFFAAHKSKVLEYGQSLNKLIEYMFSGKPILASFSGYETMLNEANCGVFVDPDDLDLMYATVLKIMAMSLPERTSMGMRGREWIMEHRNYDALSREYLAVLEDIV